MASRRNLAIVLLRQYGQPNIAAAVRHYHRQLQALGLT